jgi:hypothetical protein
MIRDGESTEAPYLTATISTMNSPGMVRVDRVQQREDEDGHAQHDHHGRP